jgi:hypothetical protein
MSGPFVGFQTQGHHRRLFPDDAFGAFEEFVAHVSVRHDD